eukprot:1156446-Pelagomonas_calceolata.AAC.3
MPGGAQDLTSVLQLIPWPCMQRVKILGGSLEALLAFKPPPGLMASLMASACTHTLYLYSHL